MTDPAQRFELPFGGCDMGLSYRRLWEHTELAQINVFGRAIRERTELNDANAFVDVVHIDGNQVSLAGYTVAELVGDNWEDKVYPKDRALLVECLNEQNVLPFLGEVAAHIRLCSLRKATRNQHHPFLPSAQASYPLGLPHLYSTLQKNLQRLRNASASAQQWRRTIENLQNKGLRAQELERSGLLVRLDALDQQGESAFATDLARWCDFQQLRLSVIPVVRDASRRLRFSNAPDRPLKRTKQLPKAQTGQVRAVVGYDRVLGYKVEQVEHQTLWGPERHWIASTNDGFVIQNAGNRTVFTTAESAMLLADSHAKLHFPKRVALGRWRRWAWTGGQDYTEWLITLPYCAASFFSTHFDVRNVLAHLRCDVREGADGQRVLLLHEVQSDWAQEARRAISVGDMEPDDEACPPFLKEWPALVMKLVLLHAANRGLDAVAWTRGAQQVFRYKGLGATGLIELYDRTLPKEVNRMLKPYNTVCKELGVFVPTNFGIKQSEYGYEVYTAENELLATAPTLEDAQQFVPPDARELLYEVHGVDLPKAMRREILENGFPAWG